MNKYIKINNTNQEKHFMARATMRKFTDKGGMRT